MDDLDALLSAIKTGDIASVRALLEADTSLAQGSGDGLSPLMLAVYYRAGAIVDLLIESGAPVDVFAAAALGDSDRIAAMLAGEPAMVNQHSVDGWTPLALAAHFGHLEAAQALVAAGAELDRRSNNETGNLPIHAAVAGKQAELVAFLLSAGSSVNAQDAGGWTPINLAAHEGRVDILEMLLAAGADPSIPAHDGSDALATAAREGNEEAAALLRGDLFVRQSSLPSDEEREHQAPSDFRSK